MKKFPTAILVLRKSARGEAPVLKGDAFPLPFIHEGKRYVISRTRRGKLIMTTDE